jgi:transcriptional regulator with XRE-family HTH domain
MTTAQLTGKFHGRIRKMNEMGAIMLHGETLRAALRDAKRTQRELAEFLGVDPAIITRMVQGGRVVTEDEEVRIRAFLGGDDEGALEPRHGPIPVYGLESGEPNQDTLKLTRSNILRYTPRHPAQANVRGAFAIEILGDAMEPRYQHREIAFAVRNRWPRHFEDCVIEYKDGASKVRQFIEADDKQVTVASLNPGKRCDIDRSNIRAVHGIVGRG